MATAYLEHNVSNRPLRGALVRDYVEAMRRGEWLFNGETIKFDLNRRLVDGQHRLKAVERFGKPCTFLVVRGLDPRVFQTIDTGKVRTGSDIVALKGFRYSAAIAAAYRHLHKYLHHRERWNRRVSNTELVQLMDAHAALIERGLEAVRSPLANPYLTHAHSMFAFFVAASIDAGKARAFFAELGGAAPKAPAVRQLKERFVATLREEVKPPNKVRVAWTITAWNHFYAGRRVLERFTRIIEEMPRFDPEPPFKELQRAGRIPA